MLQFGRMVAGIVSDSRIETWRDLVNSHLQSLLDNALQAGHGEVAELAGGVLMAGGKRIRPILVLLAHELAGGQNESEIMPLALAFELIHTATLVHDDINDGAEHRRGIPTIHVQAGMEKALIAGDWLFVQGFGQGGRYGEDIVEIVSDCCARIASSELKQLDHILDLSTTPDDYFQIVRGKTAGPFGAGCQAAALVAGASTADAQTLERFGMELGIAFQLVDDLLDLLGDERMGKPRGADVYEGKMTLPLIHSLTLLHGESRLRLAEVITNFDDEVWPELIDLLEEAGSIDYSRTLVKTHLQRGLSELHKFPDCEARRNIENIAEMVMKRHL